jgi:hypothetical protein
MAETADPTQDTPPEGEQDTGRDDGPNAGAGDGDGEDEDHDDPRVRRANREAAKYRARAKAAEEKLQAAADKEKSEQQKLAERAKAAEDKAAKLEHEAHQRTAAEKAGLPQKYASRLRGDSEDELLEDAKEMADDLGHSGKDDPPAVRRGPQGRKGGSRGASDMNSLVRRAAGRR